MIKVEFLTDTTVAGLQARIEPWTHNGWRLHEGIVITAWEDVRSKNSQGEVTIHATACGFLQVLTRSEGAWRKPQASSESD